VVIDQECERRRKSETEHATPPAAGPALYRALGFFSCGFLERLRDTSAAAGGFSLSDAGRSPESSRQSVGFVGARGRWFCVSACPHGVAGNKETAGGRKGNWRGAWAWP
jgi:hypothetical protein